MALIKCPECEQEISKKARACIHCGFPLKKKGGILKGVVWIVLICLIVCQAISYDNQITTLRSELDVYEDTLTTYEKKISDMIAANTQKYVVSTTKEYADWVAAQSAIEPYDLYNDLQYAYEQLIELEEDYLIGTEKYKAALNLLVPKKNQSDLESYMATLKRYFGTSDISTVRNTFIDDLISVELLTEEKNNYLTWNRSTLTTNNVMSKLNLTEDVANALMGMLRTMDWDV